MKEAIGNSMIFTLVITFVSIFIIFFAGFTNYTKAFKVKNRIISILEDRKYSYVSKGNVLNSEITDDIRDSLSSIGYRTEVKNTCEEDLRKRFGNKEFTNLTTSNNTHRYCIASFKTSKGYYYATIAYMYFEIPLIGKTLNFPVYGETRIIGLLD